MQLYSVSLHYMSLIKWGKFINSVLKILNDDNNTVRLW